VGRYTKKCEVHQAIVIRLKRKNVLSAVIAEGLSTQKLYFIINIFVSSEGVVDE